VESNIDIILKMLTILILVITVVLSIYVICRLVFTAWFKTKSDYERKRLQDVTKKSNKIP
jgi:hypothetical protein